MSTTWDEAFERKCRACAKDYEKRISDLEAGVAAGKRAAQTCRQQTDAFLEIESMLDLRRAPQPRGGKIGIPCRIEALLDA